MRRALVLLCLAVAIELVLFIACLVFPGGGHSVLWYTQVIAMPLVAKIAPSVGSCIQCSWGAWTLGAVVQALVMWGLLLLIARLGPGRSPVSR
jgi:hypothetical protein